MKTLNREHYIAFFSYILVAGHTLEREYNRKKIKKKKRKNMVAITLCSLGYANALITNNNKKRNNERPLIQVCVHIFQIVNGARRENSTRRMPASSRTYTTRRGSGKGS